MTPIRILLAAMLALAAFPGDAQERTLTILVGAPAGSPADAIAHAVARELKVTMGMKIVVDNKPGKGGHAAAEALRAAAADGTTILIAPETLICIYPAAGQEIGYQPFRHFMPVTQAAKSPFVLAVAKDLPAKTVAEYLKWAAVNGDKAVFGSPAAGSPPHFFGMVLAENAGIKLKHAAYDNSAALMADLAGGKLVAAVDTLANVLAQHRAGKVRILAVSGAKRSALLPAVPTFTEEGLKDPGGEGWYAFFAPFSTPKVVLERLSGSIRAALKSPEAGALLAKQGLEATGTQTYELRAIVHADYVRWSPAAKASGFTVLDTPNLLIH